MLNTIEVLFSKALIDSYINHDKFISVNNVLSEYNEIKEEIKNPKCCVIYYINTAERIVSVVTEILGTKIQVSEQLDK